VESGPFTGSFFYTRDHLGSVRELTDAGGNVRARYAYDPYGRRTRLTGDWRLTLGSPACFGPLRPIFAYSLPGLRPRTGTLALS